MEGCRLPVAGLFDSVNEIMKKYLKRGGNPPNSHSFPIILWPSQNKPATHNPRPIIH